MRIRELMVTDAITVSPCMTLKEAAAILQHTEIDGAPVVDDRGVVVGLFTLSHAIQLLLHDERYDRQVSDVMTTDIFTLQEAKSIAELQREKQIYRYGILPVVDDKQRLIGIVHQKDLLMYLSERLLFVAEERQEILNSMYNGVIATNGDGIITVLNPAAEFITGITAESVLGRYIDDVIPTTGLRRVLETGTTELNQHQMIGRSQIVTNRSPIIKDNKNIGAVAVFQDITELQAMAAELETVKNLKSTLESAIESLFEGIVVVNREGIITMMNRAYCEFLGQDIQFVTGKHVTEVIPNTRMHLVAQAGKAESGEVQRIGTNNVVVTRIPIIKDGEVVGAVGKMLFRDVKDMKILYGKLNKLQSELDYYKEELRKVHGGRYTIENIIGSSEKMVLLKAVTVRIAKSNSTVLVLGESGTGKELFAHALHTSSLRAQGPFIKVNCAAVPENLLESELFGYEDGAFTGARKGGKPGKFELANGGTIFLDEIGDMPLTMQAKLLRVLQEKEIERVGGTKSHSLDVRIIAATNRDIEAMIKRAEFRQDLYYRLNIISLNIPPLRERREDIPVLCAMLLKKLGAQLQQWVDEVSPEVMGLFMQYEWPGNVRELENVLERAVNWVTDEAVIQLDHLPPMFRKMQKEAEADVEPMGSVGLAGTELSDIMGDAERQAICSALETCDGNKSKAAKLLGINRSGFYQKLQKYGIK